MTDKDQIELIKLDGTNYSMWKFGISLVLDAKELDEYIDGSDKEPDKATKADGWKKWKKARSQAAVILLSSIDKKLHPNLINCSTPKEIWDKLKQLYSDSSEDTKQSAWEEYYSFRFADGESIALQVERFESICKKFTDAEEKLSDSAIESKLLSSLTPKFSPFRMAWECTAKAERKKDNLIARLIREDKRISEAEEEVTSTLALRVQALELKKSHNGQKENDKSVEELKYDARRKIDELKKRTFCNCCKEKGHWARECPSNTRAKQKKRNEDKVEKTTLNEEMSDAYVCEVNAAFTQMNSREADI